MVAILTLHLLRMASKFAAFFLSPDKNKDKMKLSKLDHLPSI